jgi:hypothetical protein
MAQNQTNFTVGQMVRAIATSEGNHITEDCQYMVMATSKPNTNHKPMVTVIGDHGQPVPMYSFRFEALPSIKVPSEYATATEVRAAILDPIAQVGGGTKHDDGKPLLALLPFEALEAVGRVMTFGAKKYAANNWRGGFAWTRLVSSSLRHIFSWVKGEDLDPESGESHLAHAACCILFLLTFVLTKTGEDDRYKG